MKRIGRQFKMKRIEKELTLQAAARQIGASAMYISNIENEVRINTKSEKFAKLCKLLGFDVEEMKTKVGLALATKSESTNSMKLSLARTLMDAEISDDVIRQIENVIAEANTK